MSLTRSRGKKGEKRREEKRRLIAQDLIDYAIRNRVRLEDVSKHIFYTEKHANAYDGVHRKGLFKGWQDFKDYAISIRKHHTPEPRVNKSKRYVVTWAQNATAVFEPGLRALETFCRINKAELVVVAGTYKNPTSRGEARKQETDHWWDERLAPYLFQGEIKLHDSFKLFGNAYVQPTAANPTNGMEVVLGHNSAVVGHPRVSMRCVPSAFGLPRVIYSTGAITEPSYSKSAAGFKAEQHHTYAALLVEIDDARGLPEPLYHCRQLMMCGDGSFIDFDLEYFPDGTVRQARPAKALICGDTHVDQGPGVHDRLLFDTDSIAASLAPDYVVLHDVLDFRRRNHHTRGNLFHAIDTRYSPVRGELENACAFLIRCCGEVAPKIRVVGSNHDEAFDRWLNETDPKADPVNALFFHQMWLWLLEDHRDGIRAPAFETFFREYTEGSDGGGVQFVGRAETLMIGDIACHFHGDKGVNGSRGTPNQWRKLSHKSITGHTHTPFILDGAWGVGVSGPLDMGYNLPPSTWLNSSCAILANGKRQMYNIIEGRFRLPPPDLDALDLCA